MKNVSTEIKKLKDEDLVIAGKLILATPMSEETFEENYQQIGKEQLQKVLIDYFSNPKNVDFYAETVIRLLVKKGLRGKVNKKADIIREIFEEFDIPSTKKERQDINELHKNGVLDKIQEFIELEYSDEVLFDCVLYDMLFIADITDPVEAEVARLEGLLKLLKGEKLNVQ